MNKVLKAGQEQYFHQIYDIKNKIVLNFTDILKNSNKFYTIELQIDTLNNVRLFSQYGRVAGTLQNEYRIFDNELDAQKEYDKIVKAKTKKGYQEIKLVKADIGSEVGKAKVSSSTLTEDTAKKLGKILLKKNPDSWWFDADDAWFVDRKKIDQKWDSKNKK